MTRVRKQSASKRTRKSHLEKELEAPVSQDPHYRKQLRESILFVTDQFLRENRKKILKRALDRVKAIRLLSV